MKRFQILTNTTNAKSNDEHSKDAYQHSKDAYEHWKDAREHSKGAHEAVTCCTASKDKNNVIRKLPLCDVSPLSLDSRINNDPLMLASDINNNRLILASEINNNPLMSASEINNNPLILASEINNNPLMSASEITKIEYCCRNDSMKCTNGLDAIIDISTKKCLANPCKLSIQNSFTQIDVSKTSAKRIYRRRTYTNEILERCSPKYGPLYSLVVEGITPCNDSNFTAFNDTGIKLVFPETFSSFDKSLFLKWKLKRRLAITIADEPKLSKLLANYMRIKAMRWL